MRLSPITSRSTTTTQLSTLFTTVVTTAGTAFLLSTSPTVLATTPVVGSNNLNQRNFRLGHPAAHINKDSAQRFFSSMSSSSSSSLPAQNDAFEGFADQPRLEPSSESAQLTKDAMDLFSAKPSPSIFARSWSPSAIFADPICHAEGSQQYLAQWYGMPAAFSHSETLEWKLTKDTQTEVQYVQKQRYKVKGLGMQKDMVSTVVMERDRASGKITRFEDRWNHKPLGGVFGWPFRRLNAVTLPWLAGVPKEAKQAVVAGKAPKDL